MTDAKYNPGPIAQLRHASRSPASLALGGLIGAIVPIAVAVTVHQSGLIVISDEWRAYAAWLLVAGGMAFSAKTVYRWGYSAFDDKLKALGFVLLIEAALLLCPSPALGYTALAYLTLINGLGTGATLAIRDRTDIAREALQEQPPQALPAPSAPTLPALVATPPQAPAIAPEATPPARPVPPPLPPRPAVATAPQTAPKPSTDYYERALAYALSVDFVSVGGLQAALKCRQTTASELVAQLESAGIVSAPDLANRKRRQVLARQD